MAMTPADRLKMEEEEKAARDWLAVRDILKKKAECRTAREQRLAVLLVTQVPTIESLVNNGIAKAVKSMGTHVDQSLFPVLYQGYLETIQRQAQQLKSDLVNVMAVKVFQSCSVVSPVLLHILLTGEVNWQERTCSPGQALGGGKASDEKAQVFLESHLLWVNIPLVNRQLLRFNLLFRQKQVAFLQSCGLL